LRCPLIGVDRKWLAEGQTDAIDPLRTFLTNAKMTSWTGPTNARLQ